jgi:hypothetical protein
MKEYALLPSCVSRERECANRECKIMFSPKNDKAKFHCKGCKDREGYLRLQDKHSKEFEWFKIFLYNIKVIEKLVELGYEFVTDEVLSSHRFNKKVGMFPVNLAGIGTAVLYGKYYLLRIEKEKFQIIKNEEDGSN